MPYGILRRRGIGVRYAHGTGNDLDVTAAELAAAVVEDDALRLLLLYLENVGDPESLVELGERSRRSGVPVVALVGGRSQSGSRAAASHTGALATERRVLDAFLERVGIWQVHSVRELVAASELYLQDWAPRGRRAGRRQQLGRGLRAGGRRRRGRRAASGVARRRDREPPSTPRCRRSPRPPTPST